jgi:hypothetical protein
MTKKAAVGIGLFLLCRVVFYPLSSPQEFPAKKPKTDYMSSFLLRNTKPLGLKEDQALKDLLQQPSMFWAVRTGTQHILK